MSHKYDWSKYTGPSPEWTAFATANSQLLGSLAGSVDTSASLEVMREQAVVAQANGNAMRVRLSQAQMAQSGLAAVVATEDHAMPTRDGAEITIRSYRVKPKEGGPKDGELNDAEAKKPLPAYVYLEGGGFMIGSLDTEVATCSALAHEHSMVVIHICVRHTPQVQGLVPWHDAQDGFDWIMDHVDLLGIDPQRVVVGGISAGGMLAATIGLNEASTAAHLGKPNRIRGQVLGIPNVVHRAMFPMDEFVGNGEQTSPRIKDAPVLSKKVLDLFTGLLAGEPDDDGWNPLLVPDAILARLPRTAFLVAGLDPLRDEALLYATKLRDIGIQTKVHIWPGLPHGFYGFPLPAGVVASWDQAMCEALRWARVDDGEWIVEVPPVDLTGTVGGAEMTRGF